jgi:hypothetical protein
VPELEKYARARGWSIFVPDLKLDVWRRNRDTDGGLPTIEYAIVYRGTTGSGGWLSNLRVLTGFTPLIYDQYLQARESTQSIINQVMFLHSTSDKLLGQKTRVLFTAVGHSLGAGIANYVYYVSPRITRVVGFDPSPIDGGGTIPLEAREAVMEAKAISLRKQVPRFSWTLEEMRAQVERDTQPRVKGDRRMIDEDPRYPGTSIFMLYERGEILSRIAPCQSGPMWGQTGPKVSCNVVDLLKGDPISQHSMDELACSLHRIAQRPGEPPMRSVRH